MDKLSSLVRSPQGILSLALAAAVQVNCGTNPGTPAPAPMCFVGYQDFQRVAYREPGNGLYIINGDIPVLPGEWGAAYSQYMASLPKDPGGASELSVNVHESQNDVWSADQKLRMSYCVSQRFGARHGAMVAAMAEATRDWEQVADLKFVYVAEQDAACDGMNSKTLFDVSPVQGQPYWARAFFPHYERSFRNILVDDSAFTLPNAKYPFTLAGILRHELGHTLGFRHEHIRPESASECRNREDTSFCVLTIYDAASVMHYPYCNGTNTGDLTLTNLDKEGAQRLYGKAR